MHQIEVLRLAAAARPLDLLTWYVLADALDDLGRHDEAARAKDMAAVTWDVSPSALARAFDLADLGDGAERALLQAAGRRVAGPPEWGLFGRFVAGTAALAGTPGEGPVTKAPTVGLLYAMGARWGGADLRAAGLSRRLADGPGRRGEDWCLAGEWGATARLLLSGRRVVYHCDEEATHVPLALRALPP